LKAFVTGATGFLGSHVARVLSEQGADLRLLVRSTSNLKNLEGLRAETAKVEITTGDLRDSASLEKAMSGCDTVFHVAADYRLWVPDPAEMYRSNVEGTRAILEAARKNTVRCVVYTSSVATIGFTGNGHPADEDSPVSLADMIGHYKRSKFLAELEAIKAAGAGVPVVIVNPTAPVGPADWKPTPTGRIIVDFLNGKMPAYVDTGLNVAPVEDVAKGHLLAGEKGRIGERYILGGRNMTLKQILDALAPIAGRPAPRFRLPHAVALAAGYADELYSRIAGREPQIPVEGVKMSRHRMFVTTGKAEGELGYEAGSVEAALERSVRWYQEHGYVQSRAARKNLAHAAAA
jgi:dihydroflavonol-4-reductase